MSSLKCSNSPVEKHWLRQIMSHRWEHTYYTRQNGAKQEQERMGQAKDNVFYMVITQSKHFIVT